MTAADRLVSLLFTIGSTHADPPPSPIATTGSGPYRSASKRWRLNLVDSEHLDPLAERSWSKQYRFYRAGAVRQQLAKAAVDAGRTLRAGSELEEAQRAELFDACRAYADFMDLGGAK